MRSFSTCLSAPRWFLASVSLLFVTGCQDARIAGQGIGFREALVKMYDDEVWDSLIRAKQNRPFVLLNYTEVFAQDAEQIGASGGGGEITPSLLGSKSGWRVDASAQRAGVLNF